MTYNIRNGRGSDRRVDLGRVAALIAAFDPDVVAMQEVDLSHARSSNVDQAAELASRLAMTASYAPYLEGGRDRHGIATLTRLPVTSTRYLALPGRANRWVTEPRCALVIRIACATRTGTLDVVNTHLPVVPADRESQVAVLADVLDTDELIVLGDLNCTTRSAPFRTLSHNMRQAAGSARSWPARLPMIKLDHILVRGSLSVIMATRAETASPMFVVPAVVFGVVAATSPALYIATAVTGTAPPLGAVVRAFGVALGAFGIALAGLLLPAAFLALSSTDIVTTFAAASAAVAAAAFFGLRRLAAELVSSGRAAPRWCRGGSRGSRSLPRDDRRRHGTPRSARVAPPRARTRRG